MGVSALNILSGLCAIVFLCLVASHICRRQLELRVGWLGNLEFPMWPSARYSFFCHLVYRQAISERAGTLHFLRQGAHSAWESASPLVISVAGHFRIFT